jgi:hypothetical protein
MRARPATVALLLFSQCSGSQSPPAHHAVADEPTASLPTYVPSPTPPATSSAATLSPPPISPAPPLSPSSAAPAAVDTPAPAAGALLAHYTFDDCSARDVTGNGHDGRLVGKPSCVAGPSGKALHFDGKQYVTIDPLGSDDALRSQLSVTGWVNASGFNDGYRSMAPILTIGHKGFLKAPFAVDYQVLGDGLRPSTTLASASGQSDSTYLNGTSARAQHWFFFAWVFQAGKLSVYHDDGSDAHSCKAGFTELASSAQLPIELGRNANGITDYLIGTLDDIRIYDYALSAAELRKLWQLGSPDDAR